jgi:GNAT superfamily N-acetyltransferase
MHRRYYLSGLHEYVDRRYLGAAGDADTVIDTGYGLEPIGRDADEDWKDDFEFPEDGSFDLYVWDGRAKRAVMHGRVLWDACALLEQYGGLSPDDCEPGEVPALTVDYVRVAPEFRGQGYAARLVDAAIHSFTRRGWWIYADCYSQLIYKNLRYVLGAPFVATPEVNHVAVEEPFYRPTDQTVLDHLDPLPVEGTAKYKSGYQLGNERHVHVLWKR